MNNNPIVQNLLTQLQSKNPQMFQAVNEAMKSGENPDAFFKQIIGNATPEQRQNLFNQAKTMGVPNDVLNRLQNMK